MALAMNTNSLLISCFPLALGALGLGVGRGVDKWWETLVEGLERGWEKWGLEGVVSGFGFSTFISPFDGVFPRLIALFFGFSTDFSFPRWGFSTVCGELGGGMRLQFGDWSGLLGS